MCDILDIGMFAFGFDLTYDGFVILMHKLHKSYFKSNIYIKKENEK